MRFNPLAIPDGTFENLPDVDAHNANVAELSAAWDETERPIEVDPMKADIVSLHNAGWDRIERQVELLRAGVRLGESGQTVFETGLQLLEQAHAEAIKTATKAAQQAIKGLNLAGYSELTGVAVEAQNCRNSETKRRSFEFYVNNSPAVLAAKRQAKTIEAQAAAGRNAHAKYNAACATILAQLRSIVSTQSQPA